MCQAIPLASGSVRMTISTWNTMVAFDKSDMQSSSTEQYLSDKLCRGSQLLWVYRTPVFYSPFLFRMAQPGGDVQLESSSEVYRELAVDVEGLEETDGNKGQKKGDLKIIQNGTFLLICNWSLIVNFLVGTLWSADSMAFPKLTTWYTYWWAEWLPECYIPLTQPQVLCMCEQVQW